MKWPCKPFLRVECHSLDSYLAPELIEWYRGKEWLMTCSLRLDMCWSGQEEGIVLLWKLHCSTERKLGIPLGKTSRAKARESTCLKVGNWNEYALFRTGKKKEGLFFMNDLHKPKVIHNNSKPRPKKALCQDFEGRMLPSLSIAP